MCVREAHALLAAIGAGSYWRVVLCTRAPKSSTRKCSGINNSEIGPRLEVSLDRLEDPGMEPGTLWSRDMIFPTVWNVRPAKAQNRLRMRAV